MQDSISGQNVTVRSPMGSTPSLRYEGVFRGARGAQSKVANGIREYLAIFFKHKLAIISAFFCILIVASISLYFLYIPKYQAKSLLLVKFGWENFTPDLTFSTATENKRFPTVNQSEIIQSEVRILRSRDLIERVVTAIKPESIYPELTKFPLSGVTNTQAAISYIERDLVVIPGKGNIMEVTLRGENPITLAAVVNQLVAFYVERRNEIFKDPKSAIFLQKKVDEYSLKLSDSENRLTSFKNEAQIVSFDDQRKINLAQRAHLVKEIQACESFQKEIIQKISEFEKQMTSIPEKVNDAGHGLALRITGTEAKLLSLQLQERELLSRYKEENKLVVGVREQIAITEKYLEAQSKLQPAETTNPVWQKIQQDFLAAKAELTAQVVKAATLDQQIRESGAKLQSLEDLELKHNELTREVSSNDEKLRMYRQRLEESKIQDELERQKLTSVSVIERAAPEGTPVNPLKLPFLIPAVIAGAFLGSLGLGYLLEMAGHGVSTPVQAEKRLELPVLVAIGVK